MSISQELAEVPGIVRDFTIVNMNGVAAFTWLLYDCALTFDDEVEHIWRQKWTWPKVLYLCSRYLGLFYLLLFAVVSTTQGFPLNHGSCQFWGSFIGLATEFVSICVNLLLVLRIRALYTGNRGVLALIISTFITETIIEIIIITLLTIVDKSFLAVPAFLPINGCLLGVSASTPSNLELVAWVPALITSTLYFALTLVKLYPYFNGGDTTPALLTVFVRDGTLFFGIIFIVLLIAAIIPPIVAASRPVLESLMLPWLMASYALSGPRLLLGLRGAVSKPSYATAPRPHDLELQDFRVEASSGTTYNST